MKVNISAKLCYHITSILSLCITIAPRQITSVNAFNEKMCDPLQLSDHSRLCFWEIDFHLAKRQYWFVYNKKDLPIWCSKAIVTAHHENEFQTSGVTYCMLIKNSHECSVCPKKHDAKLMQKRKVTIGKGVSNIQATHKGSLNNIMQFPCLVFE